MQPDSVEDVLEAARVVEDVSTPAEIVEVIEPGLRGPVGPAGDLATFQFSLPGVISSGYVSPYNWAVPFASTVSSVIVTLGTAPSGGPLTVEIKKNTTTIYAGGVGRPSVAAGQIIGSGTSGTPSPAALVPGDILTFSIPAAGTAPAAANLLLFLNLLRS